MLIPADPVQVHAPCIARGYSAGDFAARALLAGPFEQVAVLVLGFRRLLTVLLLFLGTFLVGRSVSMLNWCIIVQQDCVNNVSRLSWSVENMQSLKRGSAGPQAGIPSLAGV
jgi:hypothetical protein